MATPVVEVETEIAATPDTVWKHITAKKSGMFPHTTVSGDWAVGHKVTFNGEWEGKKFTDRGEVLSNEEPKELSFTHWSDKDGKGERPASYNVVKLHLTKSGSKTKVKLSQLSDGAHKDFDDKSKSEFKKNWSMMLDGLKKSSEAA